VAWLDIGNCTSCSRLFFKVFFWWDINFSGLLDKKKYYFLVCSTCVTFMPHIYIVNTVCWYVCLTCFHHMWLEYCLHIYKVLEKSYTWLIYWFISLCLCFITWHDLTWLDNPVRHCTWDKTAMNQHSGSHFLIISSVWCKDGNDSYEQLVHLGEFGSKCLDA